MSATEPNAPGDAPGTPVTPATVQPELREELARLRAAFELLASLQEAGERGIEGAALMDRLDDALGVTCRAVGAEAGALLVPDPVDGGDLVFVAVHGPHARTLHWQRVVGKTGIAGWVAARRKPAIVNNAEMDERFTPEVDRRTGLRTRCLAALPLSGSDGDLLGVMEVVNKAGGGLFVSADVDLLSVVAQALSQLLERSARPEIPDLDASRAAGTPRAVA